MIRQFITAGVLALAFIAPVADAAGTVELTVKSLQEVQVTDKNGKITKKTVPVAKVVPGDEVIYVISYANKGKQPADNVVITNPVPAPVAFRAGTSAAAGATDTVSVDGGKTFGKLEALAVPGADGKPRAATGADVTHVQWKLNAPVKAGASGSVSYRVVIE